MARASFLCVSLLCLLTVGGAPVGGPAPPPGGKDDYLSTALTEAGKLTYTAPKEAAAVYRELLRGALAQKDRIKVQVLLAKCLQRIEGEGAAARLAWKDIRDAYPDDPVSLDASYRLGELYSCILPDNLEPSLPDSLEAFEYIVKKAPAGRMITILAHVNLGQIHEQMKAPEKALAEYQTVYDLQDADLEVPGEAANRPEPERDRAMKRLKDQVGKVRAGAIPRMIAVCRRKSAEVSISTLNALQSRYPDDAKLKEAIEAALKSYVPASQPASEVP